VRRRPQRRRSSSRPLSRRSLRGSVQRSQLPDHVEKQIGICQDCHRGSGPDHPGFYSECPGGVPGRSHSSSDDEEVLRGHKVKRLSQLCFYIIGCDVL